MLARIKFCGMCRPSDVSFAATLGASYVGAIFAESPRRVAPATARKLFAAAPELQHVAVFGTNDLRVIGAAAAESGAGVVQLHADPSADDVHAVRSVFGGDIWAALRVSGGELPDAAEELFEAADGIILDAKSDQLGGTGIAISWREIAGDVALLRKGGTLILAGGLNPDNVADAIASLAPDVVDVSSGVEESPGVKSPELMRRFAEAVAVAEGK